MGRFIFVVLDGVGVGALPDAADYGDVGSDTLGNLSRVVSLHLPFLERCGLGNIVPLQGVPPVEHPLCLPGRLATHSAGKDTTVGHWEHMGLVTARPFPTYPEGFPPEVIRPFEAEIGRSVLGNRAASGTAIIAELGEIHMETARPIVYTSADSVFQVAAHVDTVPLAELYSWCEIARRLLRGPHAVARVIARPFSGLPGSFARTRDRRDYSLPPPAPTYLDLLRGEGSLVLALGKVAEVFAGRGISTRLPVRSNEENLALLTDRVAGRGAQASFEQGLLFTNLVDFDMVWGHRNDVEGFARGLESVDAALPALVDALRDGDRLLITADHGVDPTTPSTDHSREYVPLLLFPRPLDAPEALYDGALADTGATAYEHLTGHRAPLSGASVLRLQPERGWRRYTPHQPEGGTGLGSMGARVGRNEAREAAEWLLENVGPPPKAAVILGSGLSPMSEGSPIGETPYSAIPHWLVGGVPGHANVLEKREWNGREVVLLRGRIHAYEGYDESEIQLAVRTLAAWGIEDLVLTSSSGAVAPSLSAGAVVSVDEVLEFQSGGVLRESPVRRLRVDGPAVHSLRRGVHASLPGPQYETPAELGLLRRLGVDTVSMSPAEELRAARQEGLRVATLAVVANAGDTTHNDVLESAARVSRGLSEAITALLEVWQATASLY